jgi:hypothetical protein
VIDERMVRLARYLDLPGEGVDAVMEWVLALRSEIGIPHSLADLGVAESGVAELVALAEIDQARAGNPRDLTTHDLTQLFVDAIRGDVTAR